jgi:acid phosphatase
MHPWRARIAGWSRRRRLAIGAAFVAVALVGGLVGYNILLRIQHFTALEPVPQGSTLPVPATRPVILIVFENKTDKDIIGAAEAPFLNGLMSQGALAADYQAVAHPSQPNYLALFSGSTQSVIDDDVHDLSAPTLADQLEAAGRTWRVFAENLPAAGCFTGATSQGGPDGPGVYVRKHNPAISFTSISGSAERCANIRPLADFTPDAADFIWVIPNMCHIMHDCAIADGDAWLKSFAGRILASPAFGPGGNGVLFITFDEGADKSRSNEIVTIARGPAIRPGFRSEVAHSHYSLLHTIQSGFGLPCLADSCTSNTLGEMFQP